MANEQKDKKPYNFGGIKDFSLEQIESEVLNDSVYLDVFAGSDIGFKRDIQPLSKPLEAIASMEAVSWQYKREEHPEKNFPAGRVTGFIAQDIERVYPIAVTNDEEGMKYVNYASLAPLLVAGMKELSGIVEEQRREIAELKKRLG